ncbi:putative RNA methyltransferase [Porphyridium purpureum]|uniref:Putative RNA methyltransferase n=1 Tax=Porphyridium purpureum TaxID=35688 RepID=A0A5J4ZA02_PORPP|nr:putative RNA methyltransferase [Porphyridium purpureum]|eukprot:POR4715..scf295_1
MKHKSMESYCDTFTVYFCIFSVFLGEMSYLPLPPAGADDDSGDAGCHFWEESDVARACAHGIKRQMRSMLAWNGGWTWLGVRSRGADASSAFTEACVSARHRNRYHGPLMAAPNETHVPLSAAAPSTPALPLKRPKKGQVLKLAVESLSYGGKGVSKRPEDGFVVFVDRAIPGEIVNARIVKSKAAYAEAVPVERLSESPHTVAPRCAHFGQHLCGGCKTQNLAYSMQLEQKLQQVRDLYETGRADTIRELLEDAAKAERTGSPAEGAPAGLGSASAELHIPEFPPIDDILGCDEQTSVFNYRNKMEFCFGTRAWTVKKVEKGAQQEPEFCVGLRPAGRWDKVLNIDDCDLQHPLANDILRYVRERSIALRLAPYDNIAHEGFLRILMIRSATNAENELELMINFVTSTDDASPEYPAMSRVLEQLGAEVGERYPNVVCVLQNTSSSMGGSSYGEEERILFGQRRFIEQELCGMSFQISANSFFQPNPAQAQVLYRRVIEEAALTGTEVVHDLFCGTGSIGLSLSPYCAALYGVELQESAVLDARSNMKRNGVENAHFFLGDLDSYDVSSQLPPADVVVVDPPRAGLHKKLVQHLARSGAKRIVYVSCNPATQVRDIVRLLQLQPKYALRRITPVDQFPHTPHIECIATLVLTAKSQSKKYELSTHVRRSGSSYSSKRVRGTSSGFALHAHRARNKCLLWFHVATKGQLTWSLTHCDN